MNRYEFFCSYDGGGPADAEEAPHGEWVRFSDAEAAVKQAREDAQADLAAALMSDCENGVKFLNEKAAEDFKKNFPRLNFAIESLKGKTP